MRLSLFFACILFPIFVFGARNQDTIIPIDKIPYEGYMLDKGWKFHAGDDPDYSKPGYDDRSWKNIDPTLDICDLPKEAQTGIGWLRIHVAISKTLTSPLFIWIYQSPAIEIYVNGVKVDTKGKIDSRTKSGTGYFDKESIFIDSLKPIQVIAIRYAHQANLQYLDRRIVPPLSILYITDLQQVFLQHHDLQIFRNLQCVSIAVLFILCLMHSFFYYFNISKKANFYFALYSAFFCLFCLYVLVFTPKGAIATFTYATIICYPLYLISGYWGIKALNSIFDLHYKKLFRWLAVTSLLGVLTWVFDERLQGYTYYMAVLVITICQLFVSIQALLKKRKHALITTCGFAGGLLGVLGVVYIIVFGIENTMAFSIAMSFASLSPAFSISLLLSIDFAVNGQQLEIRLKEVEKLSEENLTKEAEKQQLLKEQNEKLELQVSKRTLELTRSLSDLKSTQNQLIQSAKMASLGELTAGIAHEIQNPLNFVNNFSEVSVELLDELKEEAQAGHIDDVVTLAEDLKQNLQKINHHGKRADSIVKGMLQHSRTSTGEKQKTNINVLTEEFLKLSYQGLRAKDPNFQAEIIKRFDTNLPEANVAQQDMGRVLLNLFNNAFYAVNQKLKIEPADYKATIEVITASKNGSVSISVIDNGAGIPDSLKDKIMQPFFTTKPTGEGTGLGLSLSHDIVVNGHGGSLSVKSETNKYTEFTITIPIN